VAIRTCRVVREMFVDCIAQLMRCLSGDRGCRDRPLLEVEVEYS
jgi:hypothetical protein